MLFLIGVLILIVFIIICILYFRVRIRRILNQFGFVGKNLSDMIQEAKLEDQEVPKSLASMDRIYLNQIKKDFPDLNINELKRKAEKEILDCFHAVEKKDSSSLDKKMKSSYEKMMNDYNNQDVSFDHFQFHNTVLSNYQKNGKVATVHFSSSFQYFLNGVKTQDRARVEFIYVIDEEKISKDTNVLGIHCPNCGSPIKTLGEKQCSYCGSAVIEVVGRVFVCNDVVRY